MRSEKAWAGRIKSALIWLFGGLAALLAVAAIALGLSIPTALYAHGDAGVKGAPAGRIVISHVDVLTMAGREILPRQWVVIEAGRIVAIQAEQPENLDSYAQVDGARMTLMPGLIDMHAHIFDRTDLVNYLTNGVTTVRNMMGMPMHLRWREEIASGALPGPRLVTSSPTINGGEFAPFHSFPATPDAARALVRRYRDQGYDFIKLYDGLDAATFNAVAEEAHALGMDIAGHQPSVMPLADVLAAGVASLEHAEEIYATPLNRSDDPALIDSVVEQLAAARTPLTPTLSPYYSLQAALADRAGFLASVDMRRINPVVQFFGYRSIDGMTGSDPARVARKMAIMTDVARRAYAGGAVLLGTDTGPAFTVAGQTLHDEISLLSEAGIDSYDILASGTVDAAAVLHLEGEVGIVAIGARAELILVAGNPLADLTVLRHPHAVFSMGRYYDGESLETLSRNGTKTMSVYETIGWLLWHELRR